MQHFQVSSTLVSKSEGHNRYTMILRFLGTSPETSTIENLLQNLSRHIIEIMDLPKHLINKIPTDYDDLKDFFINVLHRIPEGRVLVLILDSIDQLKSCSQAFGVEWLPTTLPERVKVVLSVIDEGYDILSNLRKRGSKSDNEISVGKLSSEDCLVIIKTWLQQNQRQLTNQQLSDVKSRFIRTKSHKPLYLKLVFDIISALHSYDTIEEIQPNINGMYNYLN